MTTSKALAAALVLWGVSAVAMAAEPTAAMKSIVRRDSREDWKTYVRKLAEEEAKDEEEEGAGEGLDKEEATKADK